MRPPTACVACRNRRRKCVVNEPGKACKYCQLRHVQCSFTVTSSSSRLEDAKWTPKSPTSSSHAEEYKQHLTKWQNIPGIALPPHELCVELVDLYFKYIHDTFHSLFHRPSLMEDLANGTLPRVVLLSIISLSARFTNDPYFHGTDPRIRGKPYAQEAERLLNLRDTSLATIQACVLLGAYLVTEGEAASEALYYGIACRLAMILDLPNKAVATRLEQEVNMRVWWTLSMIDVWSSNGLGVPRALTPRDGIPYPMEETVFLELRRENYDFPSPTMMQESAASLMTQMIKLNAILVEVSQMNAAAAAAGIYSFEFDATVDVLTNKLDAWYTSLPQQLQDTPENLAYYASLGLGGMFVAVYLGYYHYGQLLYYQYLHEDSYQNLESQSPHISASSNVSSGYYALTCKSHSTALCEILYRSYTTRGAEVYYTMVGHVLVIASTVQLHILLFSADDTQCRAARTRLERNFEILTRLQTFWPTLDVCFSRFLEFHKACRKSREKSFRLDRWMLRFLFEFAKPVREKDDFFVDNFKFYNNNHHDARGDDGRKVSLGLDHDNHDNHDDDDDDDNNSMNGMNGHSFGSVVGSDLPELKPWSMVDLGFSPF